MRLTPVSEGGRGGKDGEGSGGGYPASLNTWVLKSRWPSAGGVGFRPQLVQLWGITW
jgi:hypothetical protein